MTRRLLAAGAVLLATGGSLTACGPDRDTALAIAHARRRSPAVVELRTECADRIHVTRSRAPDGKPEITIWGHPRVGRCEPAVPVALTTDQIVDGATSMAVDIAPR